MADSPGLAAAKRYWPMCKLAEADQGVPAIILLALMARETWYGLNCNPPGPAGTGDFGHGHGLMQIDDRSHGVWLQNNDWTDPQTNISCGAAVLREAHDFFRNRGLVGQELWDAALAAYNAGVAGVVKALEAGHCPDSVTTGHDYGHWVTEHAKHLETLGFN